MTHRTFDDVTVGAHLDCGATTVNEDDILRFGEEFDPLAIHTDRDAAVASSLGGLVASGIHTFALTQPPVVAHFYAHSDLVAAGRIEELHLPEPVRPGDTLSVSLDVEDKRVSATNDQRGVVTTRRHATVDSRSVLEPVNHTIWAR